jgi:RimJ/RimL family protein N-acetyltransferase
MKASYQCLDSQKYTKDVFSLVPIRWEDRYKIMQWRNEQMYHLRQDKLLTKEDQDAYFENTVSKLFGQEQPEQILFSLLKEDTCVGYGGLVHIDWDLKTAEISFIMDTKFESEGFDFYWQNFLSLIETIGFQKIEMIKLYTYAYDIRPNLFILIENLGYENEKILKKHVLIEGQLRDVIIHRKFNSRRV